MALVLDGALLFSVAVFGWIALDIGLDPARRRRLAGVGALAVSALLWTAGEILVQNAASPEERLLARRILFAGVCALPAAFVWAARVAARPHQTAITRRFMAWLLLPGAVAYSCLYWDRAGTFFLDWFALPTRRGPLLYAYAAWAWALIAVGVGVLLRAAARSRAPLGLRVAIVAGALIPTLANAEHVIFQLTASDPTPVALGIAALFFRTVVLDFAWASAYPPLARAEVVGQMGDGVVVADLEGRIVDWNAAAVEIAGGENVAGASLDALLSEVGRRRGRDVELRSFPLERRERVFATGAILADRTAMRRAELRMELATRLEALGMLASGVAHEVNNPLTYVSVNLALLDRLAAALADPEQSGLLPLKLRERAEEAPRLVADCREGVERIQRIVERLSPFAQRADAGDAPKPIDLLPPVEKAIAMAGFGKRERGVAIRHAAGLPRVVAVEHDVVHVVLHLLLNAVQMGGEDVPIEIEIQAGEDGVATHVLDGGPGIPERDLPHVFDPFFTTRRPGPHLGLGLSLCWELARRSGGRLEAADRPEGGADFTLWLPRADPGS